MRITAFELAKMKKEREREMKRMIESGEIKEDELFDPEAGGGHEITTLREFLEPWYRDWYRAWLESEKSQPNTFAVKLQTITKQRERVRKTIPNNRVFYFLFHRALVGQYIEEKKITFNSETEKVELHLNPRTKHYIITDKGRKMFDMLTELESVFGISNGHRESIIPFEWADR